MENKTVNTETVIKLGEREAVLHKAAERVATYLKDNSIEASETERSELVQRVMTSLDRKYFEEDIAEAARPKLNNWKTYRYMGLQAVANVVVGTATAGAAIFITKKVAERKARAGEKAQSDLFSNPEPFKATERPNKTNVKAI